jgi:hypothetical protein
MMRKKIWWWVDGSDTRCYVPDLLSATNHRYKCSRVLNWGFEGETKGGFEKRDVPLGDYIIHTQLDPGLPYLS